MNTTTQKKSDSQWHHSPSGVFWGEIAPCNHLVQIYDNDDVILDSLEGFVSSGFNTGDSIIIIATQAHLKALNERLEKEGFDLPGLCSSDQYIPLDAEETLAKFMVNGWPDDQLFMNVVEGLVSRAQGKTNRKVRAYGEMVAILWAQGNGGATVRLEHLWNKFCEKEAFCLFCAYPRTAFTQNVASSINHICSTHTKVISGNLKSKTEVYYKEL